MSAQCLEALEKANGVRVARSLLKQRVYAGEVRVIELLLDPPECISPHPDRYRKIPTVAEVLSWQKRWGPRRAFRFLKRLNVSPTLTPSDLSPATIRRIGEALEEKDV